MDILDPNQLADPDGRLASTRLALAGIRRRIHAVGGTMVHDNAPDGTRRYVVALPMTNDIDTEQLVELVGPHA